MRILRIDSWDGSPGGGQTYVRTVTDALAARGVEQRLLRLVDRAPGEGRPNERTVILPSEGPQRALRDLSETPEVANALHEEITHFRPDLVHLHHFDAAFTSLARALRDSKLPIVFTAHDAELVCPISTLVLPDGRICEGGVLPRCLFTGCRVGWGGPYNLWQSTVFHTMLQPSVQAFLAPSRATMDYLHAHRFRPALRLPSFIEVPEAIRAAPPPWPSGPFTVGFMGRLEATKGIDHLLDAVAGLVPLIPEIRLDIAGDGPLRPSLTAEADRIGLGDRTTFRGWVQGPAKESWFAGIHVLAFPSSVYENFGLVALEAHVRGRPVVGTDIGGIPDIVEDGVTGRLVPIRRPTVLAAALREVFEHPERGRRWAAEGRRRVITQYVPERHVERLLRVYDSVVAGRPLSSGTDAGFS
ncbi:MAG: glycosyltransferase family 4 protein [Thermoplasmata archaeon]|nr:glycosyltransferase family 4 protein [Thermoplasmata archaeon]